MWEFGVSRCKLLYRLWKKIKILLYSTGNYTQYPLINCHRKKYEKEKIYKYNGFLGGSVVKKQEKEI